MVSKVTEELMELYGRTGDPLWNARVEPLLEEAARLASFFGSAEAHHAKLFLAYPQLRDVALSALGASELSGFKLLTNPACIQVPMEGFNSPRFLTPSTGQQLKPLVASIASALKMDPRELWPEGFRDETAPSTAPDPAKARLMDRLRQIEPYAQLEDLILLGSSEYGSLYRPLYHRSLFVFGGAQYYTGTDGGLLCAPLVYSFEQVQKAYLAGERISWQPEEQMESEPEAWVRNCAATARAMIAALEGDIEAAAPGVVGHWENGEFADGETLGVMLEKLSLPPVPPTDLSLVPSLVLALPPGGHLVVGARFSGSGYGHWFNVRNNGARAEWIDGQSGTSGSWPPPFLSRMDPKGLVLRPIQPERKRWGWF